MKTLSYLGPEFTFSHQAAKLAKSSIREYQYSDLEPLASADALFDGLKSGQTDAVIVPVYNYEQGIVYDFAKFCIFEEIGSVQVKPNLSLYSHASSLAEVRTIYTKDTVLPQISQRLAQLPPQIEMRATPTISTAEAARLAKGDPTGAAICSPLAGEAHSLHLQIENMANRSHSYTEFAVYVRPTPEWRPPTRFFSNSEHPFRLNPPLFEKINQGRARLLWRISAVQHPTLHLGHIRNLQTVAKLARLGNWVAIFVDDTGTEAGDPNGADLQMEIVRYLAQAGAAADLVEIGPYDRFAASPVDQDLIPDAARSDIRGLLARPEGDSSPLWEKERQKLVGLHAMSRHYKIDLLVGGAANIPVFRDIGCRLARSRHIGAILVDYLPGNNGYAKMSTHRQNTTR